MANRVTATEAKSGLSALMSEVAYGGRPVIVERRGQPHVAMVSLDDYAIIERSKDQKNDPLGVLAVVGAWSDLEAEEIDDLVSDIYSSRAKDEGRTVELEE